MFEVAEAKTGRDETDFGSPSRVLARVDDAVHPATARAFEQSRESLRHPFFLDPRARRQQHRVLEVDPRRIEGVFVDGVNVRKMICPYLNAPTSVGLIGSDEVADKEV